MKEQLYWILEARIDRDKSSFKDIKPYIETFIEQRNKEIINNLSKAFWEIEERTGDVSFITNQENIKTRNDLYSKLDEIFNK